MIRLRLPRLMATGRWSQRRAGRSARHLLLADWRRARAASSTALFISSTSPAPGTATSERSAA